MNPNIDFICTPQSIKFISVKICFLHTVYEHPSLHLLGTPNSYIQYMYVEIYTRIYTITQLIMSYSHKSGSQKRHEKRLKEKELTKGSRTLFQVGINKSFENVLLFIEEITNEIIDSSIDSAENTAGNAISVLEDKDRNIVDDESLQEQKIDIGLLPGHISTNQIEEIVSVGPPPKPSFIPPDFTGSVFPFSVFQKKRPNGEIQNRDWLVYSQQKGALFCFPCRLFGQKLSKNASTSYLASRNGCGPDSKWKRLFDRLPLHENSINHKQCYLEWRQLEIRLSDKSSIDNQLITRINTDISKWMELLHRIIDVILFLGQRGLSFRGDTDAVGDVHNGNFLGIIELISHYDPILREHVRKVHESQKKGKLLQAHYLSNDSQNEFIHLCANKLRSCMLIERTNAKYYSLSWSIQLQIHPTQNKILLFYDIWYVNKISI